MRRKISLIVMSLVVVLFVFLSGSPSHATLSARSAFTLLEKVPPGEYYPNAKNFLGSPAEERVVDIDEGIMITLWGRPNDTWIFEVLHDEEDVRATRITWRTKKKSAQQTIFSQLTSVGRQFFGKTASFNGMNEAQWEDFGGRWIVRARLEKNIADGVTLLSGIRNNVMDSEQFGF